MARKPGKKQKLLFDANKINIARKLGKKQKLLFDANKIKKARKLRKKQKENPGGCTGEGKR